MVARNPLVMVSGQPAELPAGDTLNGAGAALTGLKNRIINGAMQVSQRGASLTGVVSGSFLVDRFWMGLNTTGAVNMLHQGDSPNDDFRYSLYCVVTTADTSIGSTEYCQMGQTIEGWNTQDLHGNTFTLSFWVRGAKTGTHCVKFQNYGGDATYIAEYTINAAGTWEYKTITVTNGLINTGTWYYENERGLHVAFVLAGGSGFHAPAANTWYASNYLCTSAQVNELDTINNQFGITGVQLELGSSATAFEHRPIGFEMELCQRYYCKERTTWGCVTSQGAASTHVTGMVTFPVAMRGNPGFTTYDGASNSGRVTFLNAASGAQTNNLNALATVSISPDHVFVQANTSTGGAAGSYQFNWAADAEII
jgi:hypothetical protein